MRLSTLTGALLLLTAAPGPARAADAPPPDRLSRAPAAQERPVRGARGMQEVPATYVAAGPTGEADLARLREAIAKLPGITKVELRTDEDGLVLTIDGDGASSQSMLVAAARGAGYRMRPAPVRFYRATGPASEEELARLRTALRQLPGIEQFALSRLPEGAALRVGGAVRHAAVLAAGKDAGYTLQVLASYVAAGPSAPADLARLRSALEVVPGVEKLELRGLSGGATLLVSGPAAEERLAAAGKAAGFIVWTLGGAEAGREFRLQGPTDSEARGRLTAALKAIEGVSQVEIREGPEGGRLVIAGAMVRPQAVMTAAGDAGFILAPVQTVVLPSVEPQSNRNTPPDYENRVLEDQAKPGEPAPLFTLLDKDGTTPVRLADLVGKRPVVLLFGSCT
jgi:hypothetical protein